MLLDSVAQVKSQRKSNLQEEKLKRILEVYPETPIINSFAKSSEEWKTRIQWCKQLDRKVLPHQPPKAIILWQHKRRLSQATVDPHTKEETWSFREQAVVDPVCVYSIDQTKVVRKHARTKALEIYWDIFGQLSNPKYKIALQESGEWQTWRGKVTPKELRGHLFGIREFALRMGTMTRHVAIDLDLHSGNLEVFTRQLRVLLERFWGEGSWHIQVKREHAAGIHLINILNQPQSTDEVVRQLRQQLCELDKLHPELADFAKVNGMNSFCSVEIKPTHNVGLRLPLAPGRVMLIDRPLEMVNYRGKEEPDVVGYINWVNKALKGEAKFMDKEKVYDFIVGRLRPLIEEERIVQPIIVPPQKQQENEPSDSPSTAAISPIKKPTKYGADGHFKGMKGRSWPSIIDAWTGNMTPDSLNHWIRQLSLYTPFRFSDQEDAVGVIEQFIDELPDWSFSDRLSSGNRSSVSSVVRRDVKLAFEGWLDQPDPKKSAKKLRAAWDRWKSTGRDPFDKSTWDVVAPSSNYRNVELTEDFDWTKEELQQLEKIAKLLSSDLETTASAVSHLVRVIHKHPEVPRTWIRNLLIDHGIRASSKKLDKPKVLADKLVELEWIYVPVKHNKGRCRQFGLAKLRSKFPLPVVYNEDSDEVYIVHEGYIDLRDLNREFMERQDEIFA